MDNHSKAMDPNLTIIFDRYTKDTYKEGRRKEANAPR
jgi:hypothetical protein